MAAIWEGSIGFGLVDIPVVLRPAEEPAEEIHLRQLDRRDLSPIGYRRYNKTTGDEVEWSDVVKGYEYEKDRYVVIDEEELAAARPKLTRTLEIVQFVDADAIDPVYFYRPYYLEPGKRALKAYGLLRDTLERLGKLGIAQVVIRTRQHVAAIGARGPLLVLYVLRYAAELRDPDEIATAGESASAKPRAEERAMAEKLVEAMAGKWKPEEWKDEYHDELVTLVQQKAKEGKIEPAPEAKEAPERGKVIDLMARLKASVARQQHGEGSDDGGSSGSRGGSRSGSAEARPRERGRSRTQRRTAPPRRAGASTHPARATRSSREAAPRQRRRA